MKWYRLQLKVGDDWNDLLRTQSIKYARGFQDGRLSVDPYAYTRIVWEKSPATLETVRELIPRGAR